MTTGTTRTIGASVAGLVATLLVGMILLNGSDAGASNLYDAPVEIT